jgi:hypothetical protein
MKGLDSEQTWKTDGMTGYQVKWTRKENNSMSEMCVWKKRLGHCGPRIPRQPEEVEECPVCNGSVLLHPSEHCETCEDAGRVFVGLLHGDRYVSVWSPSGWAAAKAGGYPFDPLPPPAPKPSKVRQWLAAVSSRLVACLPKDFRAPTADKVAREVPGFGSDDDGPFRGKL